MLSTARPRTQALTGAVLLAIGVLVIVLIYKSFSGDFGDNVTVTASVGRAGDSLDTSDVVTYRDVIIGEVMSFQATADGGAKLTLRIQGQHADAVPAGVTAIAVPASLFGATKIILLPPANLAGPPLRDGTDIAADRTPGAEGLQTALSDVYKLLTAVRPSQLDAALTALASALQGHGSDIGRLIDQTASYLDTLTPAIPDLQRTIRSFATVTEEVARNSPALLASLSNALTPAAAIVRQQASVRELLDIAPAAADDAKQLLDRIGDNLVTVIANARPVLTALAEHPQSLADTVIGFGHVGSALSGVFHNGRATANVVITDANAASLVPVLLGQKTDVVDALADPPPYTAADCPRYPGASGPNCGGGASGQSAHAVLIGSGAGYGGRVGGV
ncbi:MAG: MCE family protein, partial [Actinomycetota bacterium]|nr:MCE family protein [Actinomycetota bacterium]